MESPPLRFDRSFAIYSLAMDATARFSPIEDLTKLIYAGFPGLMTFSGTMIDLTLMKRKLLPSFKSGT